MAYKDILVVADDTPESKERVQYAIRLAARHEAHAIGMMLRDDLSFAGYAAADVFSGDLDTRGDGRRTRPMHGSARGLNEALRRRGSPTNGIPRRETRSGRPPSPADTRTLPSSDRVGAKAAPSGHPGT